MRRFLMILILFSGVLLLHAQDYDITFCHFTAPGTHKTSFSRLFARTGLETGNEKFHNDVKVKTFNYKTLCDSLEMYDKAFGWIEAAFTGLKTVVAVTNTVNKVKDKSEAIYKLLEDYYNMCLLKKRVTLNDTIIYGIGRRGAEKIKDDCVDIGKVVVELAMYTTALKCTTERLVSILDNLDESLVRLGKDLDLMYFQLYKYIMSRTHMWKQSLASVRSRAEYGAEALDRWRNSLYRGSGMSR